MKPNFLFIGPDKSGGTWLWKMLEQHPEIYVAPGKDIYFFDRYWNRGMEWYERHFTGAAGCRAIGEFSHDYMDSEIACRRIARSLPRIKLIAVLRDPVERAFSEYLFLRRHQLVRRNETFREAAERFPSIVSGGMYGEQLKRYLRFFNADSVFIGEFRDIRECPVQLLRRICVFLGVDLQFEFRNVDREVLTAAAPRIGVLALLAKRSAVMLRERGWSSDLIGRVKGSRIIQNILYRPFKLGERPELGVADRRWLCELYGPDIDLLEEVLGRSFGGWLRDAGERTGVRFGRGV